MKVGVIGIGEMGKNHLRVYSEMNQEIIGISDINEERGKILAEKYNTQFFKDYKELLKKDLDAVSIVVPTTLHKKVALDCMEKGINLLIEKPIADTLENALKIKTKAEKEDLNVMIGHIERFNPIIETIKENLRIKDVISINITRLGPFPPRINDVGVIIDLAVHDIDLLHYITGSEFKKIYPLVAKNTDGRDYAAILSFEMANGVLGNITANWLTPFKVREIEIAMKHKFLKGWFIEQKLMEYKRFNDKSYIVKEIKIQHKEPLRKEIEMFLHCVKNKTSPPVSCGDGIDVLEIAIQCLKGVVSV